MKVAILLLSALVAVQARNLQTFDDAVTAPWLVHLRVAKSNGNGRLDSCVGGLYNNRWIVSSASCLKDSRFVWIRYNAPNVYQPELVTETSRFTLHPQYNADTGDNDIALLDINRDIEFTDTIKPLPFADSDDDVPESGKVCGYGQYDGYAGENLRCVDVDLEECEDLLLGKSEGEATKYDFGAPLVSDGKVHGILVQGADNESSGVFLKTSGYLEWISEVAGDEGGQNYDGPDSVLVAEPAEPSVADLRV